MIKENFSNNLDCPPEYGELIFCFSLEPVSLQSNSKKREFVKSQIRETTKNINYLLSGDVKVEKHQTLTILLNLFLMGYLVQTVF